MNSEHLKIDLSKEKNKLMDFCRAVWAKKPFSHNLDIDFYYHLAGQPDLEADENPIIGCRKQKEIIGLLCFLKYFYKGYSIYSGLNWYLHPHFKKEHLCGGLLYNYWLKNCDILFSAAPRKNTEWLYQKAGWDSIPVHYLKWPLKLKGLFFNETKARGFLRTFSLLKSLLFLKQKYLSKNNITIITEIKSVGPEVIEFFSELKKDYNFFKRTQKNLSWKYFKYYPKQVEVRVFLVKEKEKVIGLFSIINNFEIVKVGEIFALKGCWDRVFSELRQVILKDYRGKICVLFFTNLRWIAELASKIGFIKYREGPCFFKANQKARNIVKEFLKDDFVTMPADSDEYLL